MRRASSTVAPAEAPAPAPPLRGAQEGLLADVAGKRERSAAERRLAFQAPPAGTVEDRWAIYTSGYVARLVESIGHDYRAVRRILGEPAWCSLVARYVRACPPREHDVARAGDRLSGFLEGDPLSADLPFLPELARLELALALAFVAPDRATLSWERFAGLGPEAAATAPLRAVPGATVLRSAWPIAELRRLVDTPDPAVDIQVEGRSETVLVWRRDFAATWRVLNPTEAAVAEAVVRGTRLFDLAGLEEHAGGGDAAAIIAMVRRLIDDDVIAAPARGLQEGEVRS